MTKEQIFALCLLIVVVTLSIQMLSMVFVLLAGLFNPVVDNKEIFTILGPAFNMTLGAFVGFFARNFADSKTPPSP